MGGRAFWAALLLLVAMAVPAAAAPRHAATITRAAYGIPHIVAADWRGLGYGVGYAYAEDNLCLLAEEIATVAGERSRHWGPAAKAVLGFEQIDNLSSDIFHRAVIDLPALRRGARAQGGEIALMSAGYAAGYNRVLREGRGGEACRGRPWVRPITTDDLLRLTEKQMLLASAGAFAAAIANAAPPGVRTGALPARLPNAGALGIGSNAWAFGGDVTAGGRGLLVGNPHFPWNGPNRFWQLHVTIPGRIDSMGATLAGGLLPTIGFNRNVAWSHTVTAARHFTLHQLRLDPADPTTYLVDGRRVPMTRRTIRVPMPGGAAPIERTLYATRFGPVLAAAGMGMGWTATAAFALRDANAGNQRALGTWLAINRARNVADIRRAVETSLAIPWVNTLAADRAGDALHLDVTPVPNLSASTVAACAVPLSPAIAAQATLLDGSRAACDWPTTTGTAARGLLPASGQMALLRRDYVANMNNSYWISNPRAPAPGLSPLMGPHAGPLALRPRMGMAAADALIAGGKVDHARAEAMLLSNRSLAAELMLPRLTALCAGRPALARACAALGRWDGRFDADSRGAMLFGMVQQAAGQDIWTVPFDPADPVNTPRDLRTEGAAGERLLAALAGATAAVEKMGVPLDARWGDVQHVMREGAVIPIHGGPGSMGILNVQEGVRGSQGIVPLHGSSYIQVVGFDAEGSVADAVLSYAQSSDPASPHFADQTRLYAAKRWVRLPFTAAQVAAAGGTTTRISE